MACTQQTWARFKRKKLELFSLYVVLFLADIATFADFLAYDKPIYAQYKGKTYFPIILDYMSDLGIYSWEKELVLVSDWDELELESSFWPPVRYSESHLTVPTRSTPIDCMTI